MREIHDVGPFEAAAREALGPRPEGVSESTYLLALREFVDMMDTRKQQFVAEQQAKGAKR